MYLKMLGGVVLILSTSLIGSIKAGELKERVENLLELNRMIVLLQGELRFHHATLSEAFENVEKRMEGSFAECLKTFVEKLRSKDSGGFEKSWSEFTEQLLEKKLFLNSDQGIFRVIQNALGYLDLTLQKDSMELAVLQIEDAVKEAKRQQEEKEKLYRIMGVTIGMLLTLVVL